jgi:6-phosphogluconate dehydrogenase
MKIGFIGLGKMGLSMVKRLLKQHEIVIFDIDTKAMQEAEKFGAIKANSIEDVLSKIKEKKVVWIMLPEGKITQDAITRVSKGLSKDDILIDGGNSFYKEAQKNSNKLKEKGINFLDIGVSGGIYGYNEGFCLMIGGDKTACDYIEPILKTLSIKDGYEFIGKSGSGHFVKMVHNGIEYGMMRAYAEGFEIMLEKKEFDLDLHKISKLWTVSSVIRSWLLELLEKILEKDQKLDDIKGFVKDSKEGRWTVKEAIDLEVAIPVIAASLFERFASRKKDAYQNRLLAMLRDAFGGHGFEKRIK